MCAVFTLFFQWRALDKDFVHPSSGQVKSFCEEISGPSPEEESQLFWLLASLSSSSLVATVPDEHVAPAVSNIALPCVPLWKTGSNSPLPRDTVSNQLKLFSSGTTNRTNRQKFVMCKTTNNKQSFAGNSLIIFILLRIMHIISEFACFQLLVAWGKRVNQYDVFYEMWTWHNEPNSVSWYFQINSKSHSSRFSQIKFQGCWISSVYSPNTLKCHNRTRFLNCCYYGKLHFILYNFALQTRLIEASWVKGDFSRLLSSNLDVEFN